MPDTTRRRPFSLRTLFPGRSRKDKACAAKYHQLPSLQPASVSLSSSFPREKQTTPTTPPTPTTTTSLTWEDIDPPTDYYLHALTYDDHPPQYKQDITEIMIDTARKQAVVPASSLPGYNDVSGAVVVDWDGLPHFLSPQEEEDRRLALQRAVQEKMLGLPRQTPFAWECSAAPPSARSVSLPKYEPPLAASKVKGARSAMR
ncbi:hypothetical protein BO71DRAFT_54636 [Aspergillus ellipticus CBS 707.79]|uniref:Uncharacterized protein n=1 Tax=Aspergillus ellipticus CBS 707.79 TaxID=1448320 RepID=A0A319D2C7_9EURO|nr:hypothetical protein BO71DRAFT_54636 [Aspergillus ellipticus CBS 707.79]